MRNGSLYLSSHFRAAIFPSWSAAQIDAATPTRGRTNRSRATRSRPIAAAAMLSDKLRFGCAIIPVFTRPAPLIRDVLRVTTNQLAGGRLHPGAWNFHAAISSSNGWACRFGSR